MFMNCYSLSILSDLSNWEIEDGCNYVWAVKENLNLVKNPLNIF